MAISLIGFKVEKLNALFISNNNICLLLASYSIVAFSESHVFHNKCINRLASGSLAIYLITDYPSVREVLDPWLLPYLLKGYGLLMVLGICLSALAIDQLRNLLFEGVKFIGRQFNKGQ